MIRAVYPGSFDPCTNGHIYIAERSAALFDEVVFAILHNPQKVPTFTIQEREAMAREALSHLPNVKILSFEGLLVDFMRKQQSKIILRGLRALSDFEYEFQLAQMNRQLASEIETLFIATDARYSYLSRGLPVRRIRAEAGTSGSLPEVAGEIPSSGGGFYGISITLWFFSRPFSERGTRISQSAAHRCSYFITS